MPKAEGRYAQHNREQIKQHPEWFPAPLKASDRRWQALVENNHFLSSDHLHNITEVAISPPGTATWQALRLGRHAARSRLRL